MASPENCMDESFRVVQRWNMAFLGLISSIFACVLRNRNVSLALAGVASLVQASFR